MLRVFFTGVCAALLATSCALYDRACLDGDLSCKPSASLLYTIVGGTASTSTTAAAAPVFVPKFFLVVRSTNDMIESYTVDATTGALALQGTYSSGGGAPNNTDATVSPDGKHLYTADQAIPRIRHVSIDAATGALTASSLYSTGGGTIPTRVAVSRSGASVLFTRQDAGGRIQRAGRDTNAGSLSSETGQALNNAGPVAAHPTLNGVMACDSAGGGQVHFVPLDAATEAMLALLTHAGGATGCFSLAVMPGGNYLIRGGTGGEVSSLPLDTATGQASASADIETMAGTNTYVAVHPKLNYVYAVTDSTAINTMTLNPTTGQLDTPVAVNIAGTQLRHVTIEPRGNFGYAIDQSGGTFKAIVFSIDQSTGLPTVTQQMNLLSFSPIKGVLVSYPQ